ncbi:hypothetical protein Cni_G13478 [Canna indica]|uniref:Acyl-ACP thioesterase-like C-terminal domain-containing protein n=1 Tax=Canna indica TaxID=4628 RepID=A0AAQ3QCR1_9LILI|nr:hypothetical protein Cni_G13478 [Canna indica]
MNRETRRLAKIPEQVREEVKPFYLDRKVFFDGSCVNEKIDKLTEDTAEYIRSGLAPRWSDMDVNQHVNNVKYIRWIMEELRHIFTNNPEPIIAAGDFNVTLHNGERLNCVGDTTVSRSFSELIADTGLLDFPIFGNSYSWTNNQQPPTLAKLDRILINGNFATLFPLSVASSGNRRLSYHNPLFWHSSTRIDVMQKPFRIENGWLKVDQFPNIIQAGLVPPSTASPLGSSLDRWLSLWKSHRRIISDWDKLKRAS